MRRAVMQRKDGAEQQMGRGEKKGYGRVPWALCTGSGENNRRVVLR
jgi:hypothetical protein